jgi:hypothetical protein
LTEYYYLQKGGVTYINEAMMMMEVEPIMVSENQKRTTRRHQAEGDTPTNQRQQDQQFHIRPSRHLMVRQVDLHSRLETHPRANT